MDGEWRVGGGGVGGGGGGAGVGGQGGGRGEDQASITNMQARLHRVASS